MTKDELMEAVRGFYGDTSRSREETRELLEEVRDEIDILIESLYEDE
ncbi:hypothetical protein FDH89_gp09 [Pseudomonas phage phiR18]|uniref:Uncharacterized protein n=2 Tax=Kochitakasuvirus TaxID=1982590 RepID=X5IGI8_BPKP2|nr:hypothetical protein FF13_gp81 [Pseudomonas phage KPP25]YP_009604309.1 hypothetical protein FDH89_gp09 [Pseudomonas phage phiR18]UCR75642.1 hypothetical protein PAER4900a_00080 [Pseudomonas phage YMC17/07/R4900a]BAO58553.1 hypothetical protein [Pseudomonas phage KPP25]BAU16337.1 hypothetical protein [Pseudomonas phage phiR18]